MFSLPPPRHISTLPGGIGCFLLRCTSQELADIVAKRFWASEGATLIQDQPLIRNVDSKTCSLRFDYCV
jgi:hypothetical protein